MKNFKQLALFTIALLLISNVHVLEIVKTNDSLNRLKSVISHNIKNASSRTTTKFVKTSFSSTNMNQLPKEGLLIDINPHNIFHKRINFPFKHHTINTNYRTKELTEYRQVIDTSEARNTSNLASLSIEYIFPSSGPYNYYHTNLKLTLTFDGVEIGYYYESYSYSNNLSDIIVKGTIYNVKPGLHYIRIYARNSNTSNFNYHNISYAKLEMFGEFVNKNNKMSISSNNSNSITPVNSKSFILPTINNPITSSKPARIIFAVDDKLHYIQLNDRDVEKSMYSVAQLDNFRISKLLPAHISPGDKLWIYARNLSSGSPFGMIRGSVTYYDHRNFLNIYNTNTNTKEWKFSSNITYNRSGYMSSSSYTSKPIDNNSTPIWGYYATWSNNTNYYGLTTTIPFPDFTSRIYVSACPYLFHVKVNNVKRLTNRNDCNAAYTLSKYTKSGGELGSNLKTGDVIEIYGGTSSSALNYTYNKDSYHYSRPATIAAIYYTNSKGVPTEVLSNHYNWKCNNYEPGVIEFKYNSQKDNVIRIASGAEYIYYRYSSSSYTCKITLP